MTYDIDATLVSQKRLVIRSLFWRLNNSLSSPKETNLNEEQKEWRDAQVVNLELVYFADFGWAGTGRTIANSELYHDPRNQC